MATTFTAADGCDLRELVPDSNFDEGAADPGHVVGMETKEYECSPVHTFDISSLSGQIITAASFFIYIYNATEAFGLNIEDYTFNIYKCLRSWVTDEATWNDYASGSSWGTAGAKSEDVDVDTDILDQWQGPETGSIPCWCEIDVLTVVQDAHQNESGAVNFINCGAQTLVGEDDYITYYYRAYGNEAGYKPYLSITHSAAEGSRNWGTIIGSKLGLPSVPKGWQRKMNLHGLLVPAGY